MGAAGGTGAGIASASNGFSLGACAENGQNPVHFITAAFLAFMPSAGIKPFQEFRNMSAGAALIFINGHVQSLPKA